MLKALAEYHSSDDESYQPEFDPEEAVQKRTSRAPFDVKKEFEDMLREIRQKEQQLRLKKREAEELPAVQLARRVLEKPQCRISKVVRFAGKEYQLNDQGEIREMTENKESLPEDQEQLSLHMQRKLSFARANHLIAKLIAGSKKINSVAKSKFDWQQYVRKQGLQEKLTFQRKGQKVHDKLFGIGSSNA